MKKNNRRGFTLVELLAVIVILAILMVSAGAGVMTTMNNSKINTFKNEVLTAINSSEDMYSQISMNGEHYRDYIVTSDGDATHAGLCVTFAGLVNNGFMNKDVSTYGGVVLVEVPFDGGQTKYMVWAHNSAYGVPGVEKNKINKLKFSKGNNAGISTAINTSAHTNNGNAGSVGIVTNLNGIKSLTAAAYGNANGTGEVTKPSGTTCNSTSTSPGCNGTKVTLESKTDRGGTGNTYTNIRCINVKID